MCLFVLTLYVMSCLFAENQETVRGSVCCCVCIDRFVCRTALLLYWHYGKEWVKFRDILFFNQ
jgi:hypothetical protein